MLSPDVTELLIDPDLGAQSFTISRKTARWQGGRLQLTDEESVPAVGIIETPSSEALRFFPEGERREGQIVIYSKTTMYLTGGDSSSSSKLKSQSQSDPFSPEENGLGEDIADEVTWQGEVYRIIRVDRWIDYGYCVAYAQKR